MSSPLPARCCCCFAACFAAYFAAYFAASAASFAAAASFRNLRATPQCGLRDIASEVDISCIHGSDKKAPANRRWTDLCDASTAGFSSPHLRRAGPKIRGAPCDNVARECELSRPRAVRDVQSSECAVALPVDKWRRPGAPTGFCF